MKNLFKVLGVAMVLALTVPAAKAERVVMSVEKMPAQITAFLNDYYPGVKVEKSWAKMMRATTEPMWYVVKLDDGTKIKFNTQGNWYNINSKWSDKGASIDLLPNAMRKYISDKFAGTEIKSIKFKKDFYTVVLSNGQKIKFDKTYGLESSAKVRTKKVK